MSVDTQCPTCDRSDFDSELGMRMHHSYAHGESLSYVELECEYCGGNIERPQSEVDRTGTSFCDIGCQHKWQSEKWIGENHPKWEGGDVETQCSNCEKGIQVVPSVFQKYDNHFCSRSCQFDWMGENWNGEEHPLWKGGKLTYDHYGSGWITFADEIRKRDSYKCSFCSLSSSAHEVLYGKKLEVHHLESVRKNNERNQDPSNVITLCVPCHRRIERK